MISRTCLILSFLLSGAAVATEVPVGFVKTVSGEAYVTTAGNRQKAALGTAVFQGSELRTAAKSSLGVTFQDETVMSVGPETTLKVDEYLFAPREGKLKLGTRLAKGTLNYVSGSIAKLKPDAVSVTTPTGTIGVRGTQFVVRVDEPLSAR